MRLLLRTRHDEGVALITVLMVMMVLTLLMAGTISFATGELPLARRDQDWNAALSAAQSGIDDYLYRINQDANYWQYPAIPPPIANPAFTSWVAVPGPASDATYRYGVDSNTVRVDGNVKLTATGKVRNTTRTVYTTLRRQNFLDYLYFTNFEIVDPALNGTPYQCGTDGNQYPIRDQISTQFGPPPCQRIYFFGDNLDPPARQDVINGPLHSNDAINIYGNPKFNGPVTTNWDDPVVTPNTAACPWPTVECRWLPSGAPNAPIFAVQGDPRWDKKLNIPPQNKSLQAEADKVVAGTGCLYTGPTRIQLKSTGKMGVTSPWTKVTDPSLNAGCLPAVAGGDVDIPPSGVVYVRSIPTDPPYTGTVCAAATNGLGFPVTNDVTPYKKCDGDVFLDKGVLNGKLTIGAENNIVITGDVTYNTGTTGQDLLGLIAQNSVAIYHPVNSSNVNLIGAGSGCTNTGGGDPCFNLTVSAAILSMAHSFLVQNWRIGSQRGTLTVNGAIAQQFRGPVGTVAGTGYIKNYVYDTRLKYLAPPHFIDPVQSAWKVKTWAEIKPAF